MNTRRALALAALSAAVLSAGPAMAAKYTCQGDSPCITESALLGKRKVALKWSGQVDYEYYLIIVDAHGGRTVKQVKFRGGKTGRGVIALAKAGDYEITLGGCNGKPKKGEPLPCRPSSEKLRLTLR